MDRFDVSVNVKVIMATNRADTLDPALLRPGRLDRKIEFFPPDRREKRLIFQVRISLFVFFLFFFSFVVAANPEATWRQLLTDSPAHSLEHSWSRW